MRVAVLMLAVAALASRGAAAQESASLPTGVTAAMIEEGGRLFKGAALCAACHGVNATGGVGPSLADTAWLHSKGTYEEIVRQVTTGVPQAQAKSGVMMPPRGGSAITDAQIRAVAAYVWSLRHK